MLKYVNGKLTEPTEDDILFVEKMEKENAQKLLTIEDQIMNLSRYITSSIVKDMSDQLALSIPDILPTWQSYLDAGEQIPAGVCLMHNGQCYRQVQSAAVTPQEHQPPGSEGMLAVYRPIEREHAGTQADPIPWVYGMDCFEGKYYSYNGHIYRVEDGGTMKPCVWYPGMPDIWQWELV